MSYVPGFDYDIFVSYAHVDNLKGWVNEFHDELTILLAQKFGQMGLVKIWIAEVLTGADLFDDVIKNRIDGSGLFLALNSNGYQASDYCRQEINWFHSKASAEPYGVRIGERMRFFNACLYDIPHTEWPEEFGRTLGFKFFDPNSKWPLDTKDKAFRNQLKNLVDTIRRTLDEFKTRREEEAELAFPPPSEVSADQQAPERYDVFLAASTLRSERTRLKSELERKGFTIHGDVPPPDEAAEHQQAVETALQSAWLSVHLLDHRRGEEVDGEETTTYPLKQLEVASAQEPSRPAAKQLIWVPKSVKLEEVADQEYQTRLLGLRDHPPALVERFLQVLPTDLPNEIDALLAELKSQAQAQTDIDPTIRREVLLDTQLKDRLLAKDISRYLLEHDVVPLIPPQSDDPKVNLEILRFHLKRASGLIMFFGNVSVDWVQARLTEATKIMIEEYCLVRTYGIYLAPPDLDGKKENNVPLLPGLIAMDNRKGFNPETVKPFLEKMGLTV